MSQTIENKVLARGNQLLTRPKLRDAGLEYLMDGGDLPLDIWMRILRRVPLEQQLGETDLDFQKRMGDEDDRKLAAATKAAPFLHGKMGSIDPERPIPFTDDEGNQKEIVVIGVRPTHQWSPPSTEPTVPALPSTP